MLSAFNSLILLVPVLGGFLFVKYSHYTRYRALRDNGYIILFKSAVIGLFFYGLAFIIWRTFLVLDLVSVQLLINLHKFWGEAEVIPVVLSLLLLGFLFIVVNLIYTKEDIKRKVILQDDDALEVLILKAYDEEKYIQITLDTGKVYVGNVTDTYFRINDEIQSIQLSPLSSGYRDNLTQELILTTYYGLVYAQIAENPNSFDVNISDFSITIRYNHIISISPFDPKIYSRFQEAEF